MEIKERRKEGVIWKTKDSEERNCYMSSGYFKGIPVEPAGLWRFHSLAEAREQLKKV
ncbi:MAG: hypothetical protein PHP64_02400 [Actinomycetota bacterium]|nr:hypothetical protein [Actinomycetota bacterium]